MKFVDKVIYFVFSVIILTIVTIFFMGVLNIGIILPVYDFLGTIPSFSFTGEQLGYMALVGAMLVLMAIKGILFQSRIEEKKDAIILENSSGKLIISRKTLENLVKDIADNTTGVENSLAKVSVEKNMSLIVGIDIVVKEGAIKDITKKLQEEVKIAIKKASDLNVAEVNVNIKNISSKNIKVENTKVTNEVEITNSENTNSTKVEEVKKNNVNKNNVISNKKVNK